MYLLVHIQRDITCRDRFFSYREMETSSTSFRRGKLNGSAHRLNVCLANRQAQSGAVGKGVCLVKSLEEIRVYSRRHS